MDTTTPVKGMTFLHASRRTVDDGPMPCTVTYVTREWTYLETVTGTPVRLRTDEFATTVATVLAAESNA